MSSFNHPTPPNEFVEITSHPRWQRQELYRLPIFVTRPAAWRSQCMYVYSLGKKHEFKSEFEAEASVLNP